MLYRRYVVRDLEKIIKYAILCIVLDIVPRESTDFHRMFSLIFAELLCL